MSDVKRYDVGAYGSIREDADGGFVSLDDFNALALRLDREYSRADAQQLRANELQANFQAMGLEWMEMRKGLEARLDAETKRADDMMHRGDSWREMCDELEERLKSAGSRLDEMTRSEAAGRIELDRRTLERDRLERERTEAVFRLSTALDHVTAAYYAPVGESGPFLARAMNTLQGGDVETHQQPAGSPVTVPDEIRSATLVETVPSVTCSRCKIRPPSAGVLCEPCIQTLVVERPVPKYDGADRCNDRAPWPTEIRCKLPPGHDGDHSDGGPAFWAK